MGYGDDIMGTGLARGFAKRGVVAAFGDGKKIIWGPWSEEMYRHNPNIAHPEHSSVRPVEWVPHYKGNRAYNKSMNGKWVWNYKFKVIPGEFYFDPKEKKLADTFHTGFTVIEPNLPWQKKVAYNKDWGGENFDKVNEVLQKCGHRVVQFEHDNTKRRLANATFLKFKNFRDVIAVLSKASLFIGHEGGMHHAAAAVGVKAVVIMGGFIPPSVVGYDNHVNLTGGAEACGNIEPCIHCRNAMKKITPDEVVVSAGKLIEGEAA